MLDASTRIDVLNLLGDLKSRGPRDPLHHARPLARQLHQRQDDDPAPRRRRRDGPDRARLRQPAATPTRRRCSPSVPQLHRKWKADRRRTPARPPPRTQAGSSRSRTDHFVAGRRTSDGAAGARPRPTSRGRSGRPGERTSLWRSSRNPIIPRDLIPRANSIFNSAVVPFGDGFAGVFRVDDTRRDDEHPRRPQRRRRRLEDRAEPIAFEPPTGASPRSSEAVRARLRPAGDLARGSLLRDLVQRLPRPDHRRRLHARLRDVPPARERLPAVQPQRRALPAQDRRQLRDAQPAERQRPHALRRHLLLREPGPRPLGPAPPRDGHRCR